jgi:hypothetical protein
MSGSITWREYTSDSGVIYSIKVDKSNARLINVYNGEELCSPRGANWARFPIGFSPRLLYCFDQYNPRKKKTLIMGNKKVVDETSTYGNIYLSAYDANGEPDGKHNWLVTGYRGESFTLPYLYSQVDSGLTDGTFNEQ